MPTTTERGSERASNSGRRATGTRQLRVHLRLLISRGDRTPPPEGAPSGRLAHAALRWPKHRGPGVALPNTDLRASPLAALVRAAFRRPLLVLLGVLVGALLGADALRRLPRDVFPDLSTPTFSAIVQAPAMSAEELEAQIAVPIETALGGLAGVRRVRSTSTLGVAQVMIEFEPDADYDRARQAVVERVAQAARELPPGTDPPLISSLSGRLQEIFEFTLEAEPGAADLMTLRDLAQFDVRQRLLAVPGVAAVEVLGGYLREYQVQLDPDRAAARGVTLQDVLHAVEGANVNAAGGVLTTGPTEWTVRAVGQVDTLADLRGTTVGMRGPVPVLLGDVADVVEAPAVRRGIAHRLDGEVVSCRVSKQVGADTVDVAGGLRTAIAALQPSLPDGVALRVVYDQSELIARSLDGVARAVGLGAVFVVLVLFGLLGDARAAAIVTLTIPLSLALAGLLLERAQIGLNTMTLGGLAIAVGLLVDASIIVCEDVVHRLRPGEDGAARLATAERSAAEVGRPIVFATLIVVAVFLPLFAMSGLEGRTYRPLAAAVITAMSASLLLALTLTPLAAGWLLRPQVGAEVGVIRAVKRVYAPLLDRCLRWPRATVVVTLLLAAPPLWGAGALGRDFMPQLDEGALLVQTFLPAEASLEEVDRMNHRAEDALRSVDEVVEVVRRTGRAERTEDPMPHTVSDVLVLLRPDARRPLEAIEADVREALERVPGVASAITTPLGMRIDEGLGGSPADVSVRVFGPELEVLTRLGDEVRDAMAEVEGLDDLRLEELTGLPQVRVEVDREAAARVGLTPGDVIDALRIGLVGEVVSQVRIGQRRYDLVVKLRQDRRDDLDALRGLLVDGHDGTRIPLSKLARVTSTLAPGTLKREAGSRRIAVEAAVTGRDLAGAAAEIEARVRTIAVPTGYFIDVGGKADSEAEATAALVRAIGLALAAVLVLLYLALDSARETAVILLTLPVALVGGVVALALAGETWNVSSLVGLIGLFGIAVQNGLVLVTQVRALRDGGLPLPEAVREASLGRVRPKLMTAGAAVLGLAPMLLLRLHGTEIERPLAVVMTGGLVTSTAFTLLALPTFYLWWVGRE